MKYEEYEFINMLTRALEGNQISALRNLRER